MSNHIHDVIVIGAGAAGLTAAHELERAGVRDVVVLEAQDYIGGRIRTVQDYGDPVELGAEFVHGKHIATWDYIEKADVPAVTVGGKPKLIDRIGNEITAQEHRLYTELNSLVEANGRPGVSVSEIAAAYGAHMPHRVVELVNDSIGDYEAGDADKLDSGAYSEMCRLSLNDGANHVLPHGYRQLIDYLARGLRIHTSTVARAIDLTDPDFVAVSINDHERLFARKVVVTVPLSVLKSRLIAFTPELPEDKQRAIRRLGMGRALKYILVFKSAGLVRELFRMADGESASLQTISNWWQSASNHKVLVGFAGGKRHDKIVSMHKKAILLLACLAQFIVIVDLAIVNVALPTIGEQMSLTASALQWIIIAYGLFFGGFLLMGGRLGDILGRRKVLLLGLGLFTTASLVAGIADSSAVLIAARAVQGLGAALIAPSALGILASTFAEGKERSKALGLLGAIGGAAGSVGVVASGLLTDGPGWQWIFFINIPLGMLLIALALKYLPQEEKVKTEKLDLLAAIAVTGGLLAFIYGLNHGAEAGWTSPFTLGAFVAAALLFALFWRSESRSSDPLVPLSAFRNRTSSASLAIGLFTFGSLFAFIYMTSLYMQQQLQFSPTQTGIAWLVTSVSSFAASILTGTKLVGRFTIRQLLFFSLSAMVVGALWLLRAPADPTFALDILPSLLLFGIGGGMAIPAIQIGALTGVSAQRVGLISGVAETTRELGAVIIIAAVTTAIVAQNTLLAGFRTGFVVIASAALLAIAITAIVFRKKVTDQKTR